MFLYPLWLNRSTYKENSLALNTRFIQLSNISKKILSYRFIIFIDDIIRVITTTSTVSSADTDSRIYFEACATASYNSKCCKQLLDHSGNEFRSGAIDTFGINDNFLQCWRKIAIPYYFMSIGGTDGWASQKIEIQFRSSKKVCGGGWLDGDNDTHGKVTLRRRLNCEGNMLCYFYVNTE